MTTPIPEVRQCQDPTDFLFGCTAVQGDGKWGAMSPNNGGHWSTDADVASWAVIQPPGQMPVADEEPDVEAVEAAVEDKADDRADPVKGPDAEEQNPVPKEETT